MNYYGGRALETECLHCGNHGRNPVIRTDPRNYRWSEDRSICARGFAAKTSTTGSAPESAFTAGAPIRPQRLTPTGSERSPKRRCVSSASANASAGRRSGYEVICGDPRGNYDGSRALSPASGAVKRSERLDR